MAPTTAASVQGGTSARLFLALVPDDATRLALMQHSQQWRWNPHAARYAPPDWHLTLHFIGAVPRQRVDELRTGLKVPLHPFDLRLGHAELWPHAIAVLCPAIVPDGLQQLHARLGHALQHLNLKTDARPYRPHITLARRAQGAVPPLRSPMVDWPVAGYALMESTGQATQRYRMLQSYGPGLWTG